MHGVLLGLQVGFWRTSYDPISAVKPGAIILGHRPIRILKVNGFSQEIVIFSGYMILLKITYFSLYFNRLREISVLSVWKIRFNRCHQLERKADGAIGKEVKAAATFANAKSEANLQKRLEQYDPARQAGDHAIERYDQLELLLGMLRETLPLCSELGRLRTAAEVRSNLTLLLNLMEDIDDDKLSTLLNPIRSHLDDIVVPFRQVERIHTALLEVMPEQIVDAMVLAWHHDHLSYQSHGKKKHYHRRERDDWLTFSEGLLDEQVDAVKVLVFEKLDSIVKASSLVEMVNSLIRPYLNSCKGQITQETLNLIMFYPNHRRYKSGRPKAKPRLNG